MVCCLTRERPGWWSRVIRWLEAAREELVWHLEPEPAVVLPISADRAREELNRRAEELLRTRYTQIFSAEPETAET